MLISAYSYAQVTRFVYQATTTPDSTNLKDKQTETVFLDTNGKKSFFYAENTIKRDSLIDRMRATKTFDFSQMQNLRSNSNFQIEKDYANQKTIFKDRIGRDQYSYEESQPMTWKILPETVKIGDYTTQKAETNYGGRTWYAWFTTDLPYSDGPYKFSGLPGMIVKLQDSKDEYEYNLMQVKKIPDFPNVGIRGQIVSISRSKFLELQTKFQRDPEAVMSASFRGGFGGGGNRGGGGNPNPQMQQMRQQMLQRAKSNNNPIELK